MRCHSIIFILLLGYVHGYRQNFFFNGRPRDGLVNGPLSRSILEETTYPGQVISTFSQKVDHFNPLDQGRWEQRMFYNPIHSDRDKSSGQDLIFLMIGGEGREATKWTGDDNIQLMQYAQSYGATVFDLEHRFFGDSRPINDMKTESLHLLTTEQALADLAYFITSMNQKYKYKNPKWITFGGSYPAQLAAKMRSKYPELVAAAVGSSAPLHLKLDYFGYADGIQQVLEVTPVQNDRNMGCADLVREAFDKMQTLSMTKDGRDILSKQMHLDPPFDEKTTKADITNFFANIYGTFQGMIQYTYDGRNEIAEKCTTAEQLCRIMNQGGDPVDNVWALNVFANECYDDEPMTSFPNNYTSMIEDFSQTDYDILGEDGSSNRGWTWLCCNEIGAFQTTDGDSIFGSTIPINYFYDLCTDMFGPSINASFIRDQNQAAQDYYGGEDDFDATNVCLPNGMFDPWHLIGYYKTDTDRNIIPVPIEGAAHCSDMYPVYDGEPAALPAARQKIRDFLSGVIYDADHPKRSSSLPSITLLISVVAVKLFA